MNRLAAGIQRFREDVYPKESNLFGKLARAQAPETLFITCADSRVVPNLITQTNPGELFHCRTIGNLIPPHGDESGGVASAVEYAVGVLKVRNIIVCGHSDCGAMKALLHPEKLESLPATKQWLKHADAARQRVDGNAQNEEDRVRSVTEQNVIVQIGNLRTHPAVADALERGELEIYGLVYDIGAGDFVAYDAWSKRFLPVEREVIARATPPEYLKGKSEQSMMQGVA